MRNRMVWLIVGSALACVLVLAGTGVIFAATHDGFSAGSAAQTAAVQEKPVFGVTQVTMRDDAFTPQIIQVTLGTTVTWTNQDSTPHNVTFSPVVPTSTDNWESGLLYHGQSYSYTFTSLGTFQYRCQEHPYDMLGTVIVS